MNHHLLRRAFIGHVGVGAVGLALGGCATSLPESEGSSEHRSPSQSIVTRATGGASTSNIVRLSTVVIPEDSGLDAVLIPDFEKRSGYRVQVTAGTGLDVYGNARAGKFDIVLSHFQHESLAAFVQDGFGEWPRLVFSSPSAFIGPAADPASVRTATDASDVLRRISNSGLPFVVNDLDGLRYVTTVLRGAAGLSTGAWFVDKGARGLDAMRAAAQAGGYSIWGVVPFLRAQQQARLPLEVLYANDQLLRSLMVTTVVTSKVAGVNVTGAHALQDFLLGADTQSRIRTFRMTGVADPLWWAGAQDNAQSVMPR